MPCPECKAEDRLCVKNGSVYRKKKDSSEVSGKKGSRIQRYQCTVCGYTSRGNSFGLPEEIPKEIPAETTTVTA